MKPTSIFLAALMSVVTASAFADVRYYRNVISLPSGETKYVDQLTSKETRGGYTRVETDANGRKIKTSYFFNGEKRSETIYEYSSAKDRLPVSWKSFTGTGEQTGFSRVTRGGKGERIRTDFFTTNGQLTGYNVRAYNGDQVESTSYNAEGKPKDKTVLHFAGEVLQKGTWYPASSDGIYYETEYDPSTGISRFRKKFTNGKLSLINVYVRDQNDDMVREEVINASGSLYAVNEYSEGNLTSKNYRFLDGTSKSVKFELDEKRWIKEAKVYANGSFICTLQYTRLPNGTVTRTVAVGPNGDVMAEYPDAYVTEIQKTGKAVDSNIGVIHKQGDWW